MKKLIGGVFLFAMLSGAIAPGFALTLTLVPQQQVVPPNQSFSGILQASNYQPDILGAFSTDIVFNPGVVSFTTPPQFLFGLGIPPTEALTFVDNTISGRVRLGEVSLLDASNLEFRQAGNNLPLAILNFVAGATPNVSTLLQLQNVIVGDADGNPLSVTLGPTASAIVTPEPSTVLLLSTGVLALMLWKWKSHC